jgi:DegV family protein with EDD domain
MTRIAWVTDSTACLDEELKNHPDVYVIPLTIIMDGNEYTDGLGLTAEQLYQKIKTLKEPAKTSQPSLGAYQNLYEKLSKDYDHIIAVLISSKLSGTVSSSEQAAQLVDIPVTTIDSKILTYPLTALLKKGMDWERAGADIEEIKKKYWSMIPSNELFVLIGSLEQLHRSGRMSGVQFVLGSMLNIKPIISIKDGALEIKEKVRSEKKALDKITQYLHESHKRYTLKEAYILYGLHEESALQWREKLNLEFPEIDFRIYPIGATIGVHAGEHTLGISWFNQML